MKRPILLSILGCLLSQAFNAGAVQGGAGHYTSGAYADFSGFPPTAPGLAVGNYFLDYDHATFSASRELPLGGIFAAGVTANVQGDVPLIVYGYPFGFEGITFSSGIGIPFVWSNVRVSATFDGNHMQLSGAKSESVKGLGDIQMMPIMAGWTNGDFKVGSLFNVWAPSGNYEAGRLANQGLGYWTFDPMLAFSWISSKLGTEFSVFTGVSFNTKNSQTDYQSGDIFHVDATLAQHLPLFGGIAGLGASAFYLRQITGDSGSGARLGSFEAETYGVGPTISYIHPIGKSSLVLDGSWLPQLHSENTLKGSYWWVKLTLAF